MNSELTQERLANTAYHLMAVKMFSLASCVMLYYDILLTFDAEVRCIWRRKFTKFTILWYLNRYLSPLGFIFIIFAFHSNWSPQVCDRYVLFPEILRLFINAVIGVIFIVRVYALYGTSKKMIVIGSLLLSIELAVKIFASLTNGTRLILPPGLVGCILVGKHEVRFAMTWVAELGFDTTMFLFTVVRTIMLNLTMKGSTMSLLQLMFRDGVIYFAVICAANIVTSVMFLTAPGDLKALNATFSSLITSLMLSRLILNLRKVGSRDTSDAQGITGLETYNVNGAEGLPRVSVYATSSDAGPWTQRYPMTTLRRSPSSLQLDTTTPDT